MTQAKMNSIMHLMLVITGVLSVVLLGELIIILAWNMWKAVAP